MKDDRKNVDIAPELLDKILYDLQKTVGQDRTVHDLMNLLEQNGATYQEAYQMATQVGDALVKAFQNNIHAEDLPNGKMYYNIAERVVKQPLQEAHKIIQDYADEMIRMMNVRAGLHIKPAKIKPSHDRMDGFVQRIAHEEEFKNVQWMLDEPVQVYCQSVVDDHIKENVRLHAESGIRPTIKRVAVATCCEWCSKLDGTYEYPDVPNTVFQRHDYCRCTVAYDPGDGKGIRQNVHTKKWEKVNGKEEVENRKRRTRRDRNKERNIVVRNRAIDYAVKLGYTPNPQEYTQQQLEKQSREWFKMLSDQEKIAIYKYSFNGTDKDGKKLYEKINGWLGGYHTPVHGKEEEILKRNAARIHDGLLKFKLKDDIIVYRNDKRAKDMVGFVEKFVSTSIVPEAVISGQPNIAIIVPKGARGAYIESAAHVKFKRQREFLIDERSCFRLIEEKDGIYYYILEVEDNHE